MASDSAPELLYHYTSQKGLDGILSNANIWATDIRSLNDWTEFTVLFNNSYVKCLVDAFKSGVPTDLGEEERVVLMERVLVWCFADIVTI